MVVVDSVQTVADPELAGAPGGVGQVREVAAQLVRLAKERSIATFLVGQVTKDGAVAGPKTLEHLVDVVLNFEGDQHHALRLVRCTKNRFGPAYEVGCFEMTEAGLEPLADPSRLFLSARTAGVPGVACTVSLEGRRPLVTEVQALVVPTGVAVPRRTAQGLDAGRLAILVAVLDRRARIGLAGNDVFAATAGGVRITEPAADLAVCLALASAARDRQVPVRPDHHRRGRPGRRGPPGAPAAAPPRRGRPARLPPRPRPRHRPPRRGQDRRDRAGPGRVGGRVAVRPGHGLARGPAPAEAGGGAPVSRRGWGTPGGAPMSMDDRLLEVLRQVAPGTALRPGLERILRANTGALIVLGSPPQVEALFTGGFQIDVPFTAQRLSELAKMDGAMVLDETACRILWANVHLMPDPAIATVETGTRHRTAERVARQAGVPVVSVSHSMRTITLYVEDWRHVMEDVGSVLSRANQAVATLEHYRARFDEASAALDACELHGQATLRDVLTLLGRAELVCRVAGELEQYVAELGGEGRLLRLQLEELSAGVEDEERLAVRDHLRPRPGWEAAGVLAELRRLTPEELSDLAAVAKTIDLTGDARGAGRPPGPARPPPAGQGAWAATVGGRAGGGAFRLAPGHPGRRAGGPGGGRGGGRRPGPPAPGGPQAPRRRRPARRRRVTPPTAIRPSTCDFVCTQPSGNDILLSVPLEGRGFRVCSRSATASSTHSMGPRSSRASRIVR